MIRISVFIWWSAMLAAAIVAAWTLVADLILIRRGLGSISDHLRHRPWHFWIPTLVFFAAWSALAIHLFVKALNGDEWGVDKEPPPFNP